jgi:hypothetical protein
MTSWRRAKQAGQHLVLPQEGKAWPTGVRVDQGTTVLSTEDSKDARKDTDKTIGELEEGDVWDNVPDKSDDSRIIVEEQGKLVSDEDEDQTAESRDESTIRQMRIDLTPPIPSIRKRKSSYLLKPAMKTLSASEV